MSKQAERSSHSTQVIACACHSAWYAYAVLALGEDGEPWSAAPEWQRESIRAAVAFWDAEVAAEFGRLDSVNFRVDEWSREHLPSMSHDNWCERRRAGGWVYGEVKDPDAKTHPCLVPHGELSESDRAKDRVVVEAYLALRTLA